jgi:hypothetical protein
VCRRCCWQHASLLRRPQEWLVGRQLLVQLRPLRERRPHVPLSLVGRQLLLLLVLVALLVLLLAMPLGLVLQRGVWRWRGGVRVQLDVPFYLDTCSAQ